MTSKEPPAFHSSSVTYHFSPMRFALFETDTLVSAGFHAAVFVAVFVVLLAVQWLFDRDGRR